MTPLVTARALSIATALIAAMTTGYAQNHSVTPTQRAQAQQVAQQGIPVGELAAGAPDAYTVKRGDTLWGISRMYLRSPWRWPDLWGMNMGSIANPHLIYPGQVLYLERRDGYARLTTASPSGESGTIRLSPKTRSESLRDLAVPTLPPNIIEAFLAEPLIVDQTTLAQAPHIVATSDQRVLMASGDRAYVLGNGDAALVKTNATEPQQYRIFRDTVPLRDPETREVLGYEAKYLGNATLLEGQRETVGPDDKPGQPVPATVRLSKVKNEIRAGDRLLPAPEREFLNYVPHAPAGEVKALVVSLYGDSAVTYAAQNQVVAINKGRQDGMEVGTVLELISRGDKIRDKVTRNIVQLPDERNGYAMVFRSFDRVSYALIMQIKRGVTVGDKLVSPE